MRKPIPIASVYQYSKQTLRHIVLMAGVFVFVMHALHFEALAASQKNELTQVLIDEGALSPTFIIFILISFIITWGVGLAPALITRYAIVRKPLSRKNATKLAICFSASCFVFFITIHTLLDEKPGNGFVWFIMFFVSRWVMTREGKKITEESPVSHGA